ncbi:unnamed protein product [Arctia plantaginis]|uniref:Malate dehydrogenase n=1 Tax=Arctia plantaginis TaxID=874455 RepID=A0A8S1AL27_ARCPL|nr:unnamed protein product [Arctia plantaginis]
MLSRRVKSGAAVTLQYGSKTFSTTSHNHFKVTVAGGSGGIGQPLCLLLKQNSLVSHLAVYDISKITPGVAVDLSHIDTATRVTGHKGVDQACEAMKDADVVLIPAGMPRKPGMTRDDLFSSNASILRDITADFAKYAPEKSIMAIITNPVNSMVPIASEVLKKAGKYDPRRVLGVTTLDIVRAATFVGQINCIDPAEVTVPVLGGHSGVTIVPALSQCQPPVKLCNEEDIKRLIKKIQEAGTAVLNAKAGGGTATLSMAYAAARFTCSILRALAGEANIVECAFVKANRCDTPYFACPILLGRNGLEKNLGTGNLNELESSLLKKAIPELLKNIKTGEDFVMKPQTVCPPDPCKS